MSASPEKLMERKELDQLLEDWTDEITEQVKATPDLAVVGIRTRGVPLGRRVQKRIEKETDRSVPFGMLDITLYRDDLSTSAPRPNVKGTEIMFDVEGQQILLVDDVLFTGRTVRAAMNELFDFGRPDAIRLAVLVDRGHRELPIRPDFVGKNMDVPANRMVRLRLEEVDDQHGLIEEGKS